MTPAVVDTDVVSFLFTSDSRAQLYLPLMRNRELLVSFMTEAELEQWILLARVGCGSRAAVPHLYDWFCVRAIFPRLNPSVGRGNGRSQGEWAPHRGRRRVDSRNRVALRRYPCDA
jgi:hypothetical protein